MDRDDGQMKRDATAGEHHAAATREALVEETNVIGQTLDWEHWWRLVPEMVVIACAAALPVIIGASVVARYTGWYHIRWANDIVEVLFVCLVFLGGAIAVKYGAHVRMGMLADRFTGWSPRLGRAWSTAILLSPLVVGLSLLLLGIPLVELSMRRELPNLHLPAGYYMAVVPVSGLLMSVYTLATLVRERRAGR